MYLLNVFDHINRMILKNYCESYIS